MPSTATLALTPSLEDYLETILELTVERPVARIRDIAAARGVKSASVSLAMKRLGELGLVSYERREFIELTTSGEQIARRVQSRHRALTTFFRDILRMNETAADKEACAIEHHLSDEGMDRLVRFFEFMHNCPNMRSEFLDRFHQCCRMEQTAVTCSGSCTLPPAGTECHQDLRALSSLEPGETAMIHQVDASPAIRQRLLDMGILPNVRVRFERAALGGDPIWIRVHGYDLSLRVAEAKGILVSAVAN